VLVAFARGVSVRDVPAQPTLISTGAPVVDHSLRNARAFVFSDCGYNVKKQAVTGTVGVHYSTGMCDKHILRFAHGQKRCCLAQETSEPINPIADDYIEASCFDVIDHSGELSSLRVGVPTAHDLAIRLDNLVAVLLRDTPACVLLKFQGPVLFSWHRAFPQVDSSSHNFSVSIMVAPGPARRLCSAPCSHRSGPISASSSSKTPANSSSPIRMSSSSPPGRPMSKAVVK